MVGTVESLLANEHPAFEVLIVDQSGTDATARSLAPLGDQRLRYLRSGERGLSRARNLAMGACDAEIVAFTDDDCDVPGNWLDEIAHAFEVDTRIAMVFGAVLPAAHEPARGLVPFYDLREPFIARTIRDKARADGMGACMALRRSAWTTLGGFDPCLGAGSPLGSAEENDFALRVLLAGGWIHETPAIRVVHRGLRSPSELDALVANYLQGTGAMFAKHLRLRHRGIVPLLGDVFRRWAFGRPLVTYAASPKRMLRLVSFCRGGFAGLRMSLDRSTGLFKPAPATAARVD